MPLQTKVDCRTMIWAYVAASGIGQFVACLIYMASCYPDGYSWHKHFISDLGRTVTLNGIDNSTNSQLFAVSTLVLGAALLPFLILLPTAFNRGTTLLRALGVMTTLGLVGIGQTPYDAHFFSHHAFLFLWIVPMLLMSLALSIVMVLDGCDNASPILMSGVLTAGSIAYACMNSHGGYVVMQKLVVLLSLIWFYVIARSAVVVTKWVPSKRQQLINAQAEKYAAYYHRIQKAIPPTRVKNPAHR